MNQDEQTAQRGTPQSPRRMLWVTGLALVVALTCFVVLSLLPPTRRPFFDAPLRSALTGLGLLGVACPLCFIGNLLRKRSASSPYFEEAFIAGFVSLLGLICLLVGLLCLGSSLYSLASRLFTGS
jgi:hypothetical protein